MKLVLTCEKCERCTVQVLVQDIRIKEPETLEESRFYYKSLRCKTCGRFNEIVRYESINLDQRIGMKDLL